MESRRETAAVNPLLPRIQHANEEVSQVRSEVKKQFDRVIDTADLNTLSRLTEQFGHLIQFATDDGRPVDHAVAALTGVMTAPRKRGRKPLYASEAERQMERRNYHRAYQADRRAAQKLGIETEVYREEKAKGPKHFKTWLAKVKNSPAKGRRKAS